MASLLDCAILAEDVYDRSGNSLAETHGWTRVDGQNWADGFAAGVYRKDHESIVAYRGTDDVADALADARMVPLTSGQHVRAVLPEVLRAYGLQENPELGAGAYLLGRLLASPQVTAVIALAADQVPRDQAGQAADYLDRLDTPPAFLVGHSLGGALAKVMCQHRGIPAIGFNSPCMGNLQGTVPMSNMNLLSVNSIGDPLSLATRTAGNLSHGRELLVRIHPFGRRPPSRPEMPAYVRPVSCPRTPGDWYRRPDGLLVAAASNLCETAMDAWEPVGRAASAPSRAMELLRQYPGYYRALATYLGDMALYHHNITHLRKAITLQPVFQQSLQADFSGI